ncbi:DUF6932 family protein [Mycobacteroides franklinii]|uniref:Uncharacterized protein n=1 Tax=Mycobacteroides franklinii TaxID=948102 RepID=A0A4R5P685_9MYCO|nr:hypothetical protein [Mycobacteroides franklinii]ORA62163.1 hypothetical protein BST24_08450 [Mycobacteroides franklinii]TDH18963.1 hypothetical protein EJ571_20475 [Mycobacteroides franklinii]
MVAIPEPNEQGFLDPSTEPYPATLNDLHDRFVAGAPEHKSERQRLFDALELHLNLLAEVGGAGKVWVDGGFITYKTAAPRDVDLVYLCRDEAHMGAMLRNERIHSLLTLKSVVIGKPALGALARMQPVGGLVDAFLTVPEGQMYWAGMWARVKGPDGRPVPGVRKGFVEVTV